jgi:phosphodiesterase/alkaline phosphatase D-like protein
MATADIISVETKNIQNTSATAVVEITSLSNISEVDIRVEIKQSTETTFTTIDNKKTVSSTGQYEIEIDGLRPGTKYDYRGFTTSS